MTFTTIAIAGATGKTVGPYIARALLQDANKKVLILTQSKEKAQTLFPEAQVVHVDYSNHNALVAALQGVDVVISAIGAHSQIQNDLNLIKAAKEAQVKRFYPSEFAIDMRRVTAEEFVAVPWKTAVQQAIIESGMEYTFVSTGIFFNLLEQPFFGFNKEQGTASFIGDGNTRMSFSSLDDIASFVVASINNPDYSKNKTLCVDSDVLTFNEIVSVLQKKWAKPITVAKQSLESAKQMATKNFVVQLQIIAAEGKAVHVHNDNWELGVQTTKLKDWK